MRLVKRDPIFANGMGGSRMRCLESSFDLMAFPDLLKWLRSARKTGALCVSHRAAIRRIYFTDGGIIACSSNEPHLLLGPHLVAHGWIDVVSLQECMKRQEGSGRGLGGLLVERGKISEIDLQSTVTARAEEVIFGLFEWQRGSFRFEADHMPPSDVLSVEIDVQTVLNECARRQEEWDRIRSVFHSPNLVVQKSKGVLDPPTVASHLERKLFESIDGRRTLTDIAQLCRTSEYAAGRFLLRQVELGVVQLKNVRGPQTDVVDTGTALNELRELLATEEYEAAVEWIDRCEIKPDGDEFWTMLTARAEAGFLATAYRTQVPPGAVPRRVRPDDPPGREAELLSSEDILLLDLIDGHWDVRSLGWIAPIRKVDVVRGLLRLEKCGCIELRLSRSEPAPPSHSRTPGGGQTSGHDPIADIERVVGELGA